jgi:hypothetical protein
MRSLSIVLIATSLASVLVAAPANAQSIRTFVSTTGSDANPCSLAQPCRHFQTAVNATAAGGEVDALDAGAYGSFTIGQAITINGQGWSYVAPPANGQAITVNAVSGSVTIRGVALNGVGAANADGIGFNSGDSLTVLDCVIQNFGHNGIGVGTTAASLLTVSDTVVSDNHMGIIISSPSGSAPVTGVFNKLTMLHNTLDALHVQSSTGQTINVTVSDSVSANNGVNGIVTSATGGSTINVMVRNSTIVNNGGGLAANTGSGGNSTIRVTRSTLTGNTVGAWGVSGTGVVDSYNDNNIDGNGGGVPGNAAPPQIVYK